jgi:hypothetical protein
MTATRKDSIDCCICGGRIHADPLTGWDEGHNAWPIKEGSCCSTCNITVVFPKRMQLAEESSPQTGPRFALEGQS